ncbi:MAG: hypothetical protein WCQ03_11405, partial [Phycisphaerae bacterium]
MNAPTTPVPIQQPTSPREAIDAVRAQVQVVATETIPLAQCNGRVLAQAIHADRDSPALDVSAMDGFAVRMADVIVMAGENGLPVAALSNNTNANIGAAKVSEESADMCEAMIGHAPI